MSMLYPDLADLMAYQARKFDSMPPARRSVSSILPGNHHAPFRGPGLDFDAVREYVPGDDIRHIDWRVTARTGSPHLKLFKEEKERHSIICVDLNATMRFGTRGTFKSIQAARCASFLGWRALAHQDRIGGCFFGDVPRGLHHFACKRTRKAFGLMLNMLTQPPQEQHRISLKTALQHVSRIAHPGSLVYLISDFMDISPDFAQEPALHRLHTSCHTLFISINDPADRALVPAGLIGCIGQDAELLYINTDSVPGRAAYAAQWQANRSLLLAATERFNIPWIALTTESDVHRDLLLALKSIGKRKKCLL